MTELLPEFAQLRPHGVYDCELVAFGEDGKPDFPSVCERLLHRDTSIPLALIVFDVLAYRGRSLLCEPYGKRRHLLERINFRGLAHVPEVFGDGHALFAAVCEQALEGGRREAAERAGPAGRTDVGEDKEPRLLRHADRAGYSSRVRQ